MPKCAGCAAKSVVHFGDPSCVLFAGDGSLETPLTATVQVDPTSSNCIECGPDGLRLVLGTGLTCEVGGLTAAGGGGGSCAQKDVYTVATPSSSLLPGLGLGTPEPFLSCADFIGDGANDGVAIQLAIDAATATGGGGIYSYPVVQLLPGYFVTDGGAVIDPKGVHIKGAGRGLTNVGTLVGGQRVFDCDVSDGRSGLAGIFEDFSVANVGGTSFYFPGNVISWFGSVDINGAVGETGDPAGCIYQPLGNLYTENCFFQMTTNTPIPAVYASGASMVRSSRFFGGGLEMNSSSRGIVQGNRFDSIVASVSPIPAINLTGPGGTNLIQNNIIHTVFGHGIVIDGTGGGQFDNTIQNNLIYDYDTGNNGLYDGIHVRDGAEAHNIQGNTVRDNGGGNSGINIATVDCNDNFVTNNDLFGTGGVIDAGTGTAVGAGNRS